MPISISYHLSMYLDQQYENQAPTERQKLNASFALRSALVLAKIETVVGKCLHKAFEYMGIQSLSDAARQYTSACQQSQKILKMRLLLLTNPDHLCPRSCLSINSEIPTDHNTQIEAFTNLAITQAYEEMPEFFTNADGSLSDRKVIGKNAICGHQGLAMLKMAEYITFLEIFQGLNPLPSDRAIQINRVLSKRYDNPLDTLRTQLLTLTETEKRLLLTKILKNTGDGRAEFSQTEMKFLSPPGISLIADLHHAIRTIAKTYFEEELMKGDVEKGFSDLFGRTYFAVVKN
ncbi:MAG: hypothetical protein EB127_20715 [Alphaproteobacteria bacterium]|nr:hypothetical protein [Alphaproteobacteria bacterium]